MAGRPLGENTQSILAEFQDLRGKEVAVELFIDNFGMKRDAVQRAVKTLEKQGHKFNVVERGSVWVYLGKEDFTQPVKSKKQRKKVTQDIRSVMADKAVVDWGAEPATHAEAVEMFCEPVPDSEPLAEFKVLGSLVDGTTFKGVILQGRSPGFSSNYLLTEL